MIDKESIDRAVRLIFLIGILFTVGFISIGIFTKEYAFAIGGFLFGGLLFGIGLFCKYFFKKKGADIWVLKHLKTIFLVFVVIQLILFISNFVVG